MNKSALLTFVFTTFFASQSFGQEAKPYPECLIKAPEKSSLELAKKSFLLGAVALKEEKFENASAFFEQALKLDCTATLLLHHLAVSYESQNMIAKAIMAYQTYLDRDKGLKDEEKINLGIKITKLKESLEAQPQVAESAVTTQNAQSAPAMKPISRQDMEPFVPPPEPSRSQVLPMSLLVVGGALALTGSAIYVQAKLKQGAIENRCPAYTCTDDSLTKEGNSARDRAPIGFYLGLSGLAAAGVGVTLLVLDSKKPEKPPTTAIIRPWVNPKGAGISYQGSF